MEETEKQEPEKPEKKKKKEKKEGGGGGLSLPLIIGAAFGIIILIVVSVIIGIVVANKFMGGHDSAEGEAKGKTEQQAGKEKKEDPYSQEESYLSKLEGVMFMETGRITTNPKNGSSMFVVVNLALEFKKMNEDSDELKAIADKEGKLNIENPLVQKMVAKIKGKINQMIGSYTEAELQQNRPNLPEMFKKELKPVFKEFELMLGNVSIQEFIIQ